MAETITVDISPEGNVKIDAQGFQGTACSTATHELELVLGGGTAKRKEKPEYYAPPVGTGVRDKLTF
jgi:hypothetical protein